MKTTRSERGAAMVELAILMLVLVPLFLFGISLSDVAYHRLEVQEAVVSTIWDFSQRNGEPVGSSSHDANAGAEVAAVQGYNRIMFADHTSAYDDPADLHGGLEFHHTQFGVHACFLGRGGDGSPYSDTSRSSQITCAVDPSGDSDWLVSGKQFAGSELTKGGLVHCWAKAWLYNFLIPEQFMQDHSAVALTEKTQHAGNPGMTGGKDNVHAILGSGGVKSNMFIRDQVAISFDTWGIMNGAPRSGGWRLNQADIAPKLNDVAAEDNPFFQRVSYLYSSDAAAASYGAAVGAAGLYAANALSKQLEVVAIGATPGHGWVAGRYVPGVAPTQFSSNPAMPYNLAAPYLVARYQRGKNYAAVTRYPNRLESTPFTSYNGDQYQAAYNARGPYNMGNRRPLQ